MKQNKYDDTNFFSAYKQMPRSIGGLEAAGEWHVLQPLIPDLHNKSVLDLGCGFGWHCLYAREQQASSVVGVDISEKMLQEAREKQTIQLFLISRCRLRILNLRANNLMWSSVHWPCIM